MPGHWTPEAKEAARQRIHKHKPWKQSTGPQSEAGKAIASRNSTSFVNQIRKGLWCYFPKHRVLARQDTFEGAKLLRFYQQNNSLYGDSAFLLNGINQYGDRWLDRLI